MTNQFGTIFLDTWEPDSLMVPSSKSHIGLVEDLDEIRVDHFKCYPVRVTKGTSRFIPIEVSVEDQFHDQPRMVWVYRPDRLCNPVDKNDEGIINLDQHLLCYDLRRVKGQPRFEGIDGIHTNNQFGPLELVVSRDGRIWSNPRELCVPSEIIVDNNG